MKKRLLSALLALALVFVLLPTTALAGETTGSDYDISINGKGWKFDTDDSGAYIPVYYYANYSFNTDANDNWATNSNLKLTKEGNTVTITIRPKKRHISGNTIEFTLEKKSTTSGIPYDYTPCIEMGNNNNLVITGKGTLNITRDEKNGIGAALCSEVGDITITDGITVKANFLKQVSKSTVGNAISVKDHNLIISGKNTKVEARNSSCNFQDLYYVSATVCVENGEIKVSDGATLSAINNFTNSYTSQYSYYSRAISGSSSKPCALTVTGENSCVIAETDNSLGKAYGHVNFNIDGAKIEVGTSSPAQTITDINNIKNYKYAKISVPALQTTSDVRIAGDPAVVGVRTSLGEGNGYYTYNKDTKTFTLENVNITSGTNAIQFTAAGTYTINLVGTNTISNVSRGILAKSANQNITGNINVILSGSGSLDISAKGRAIEVPSGNLTFNNTGAITLATTNTTVDDMNAIKVSGDISIGSDFNKNLKITTDNGDFMLGVSDLKSLNECKTITIAPKSSETRYNGTAMKYGVTKPAGNGTISCDENGVITLNGATEGTLEFRSSSDSTLVLEGTNTLSSIVTTQKGLTISGSGSLAAGSIKVHNQKTSSTEKPNLTINGATVTVGNAEITDRAIDIDGDLTVTNGSLTATSTSTKPTVQVGGNASFTGSTVTITNNSTEPHKDAADATKGDSVSSALYVKGNINITDNANVTAKVENGGGNAIGALGNITVNGSNVTAANRGQKFTTIIAENVYISGESTITANNLNGNPVLNNWYLTYPAIEGNIVNKNTDYSLNFKGEHSSSSEPKTTLAPGEQTTLYYYNVTITCGDAYVAPANYKIAGQTMYVGKYYKTDANGNITDGTAQDYNIYCDNENDFTLNNATISTDKIVTNVKYALYTQHHIKLMGTNRINNTLKHAILGEVGSSTIIIENAENASNASLTINGNFLPIYSDGKVIINAEVVIVNTSDDNSFKGLISTSDGKGAFDLGSGYKCYASTSTTGTPLEEFNSANYSTYRYLRVTTQTLETGGGSTHQHTWDTTKWYSVGDDYHARKCTGCDEYDLTNKQAHYAWPDEDKGPEGHTEKCMLCDYKYDQSVIKPHEWTGWWVSDYQPEVHAQRCNCGYQGSTHRTLKYVAINSEQHQKQCPVDGCGYKIEYKTSHVYEEGSNICTECGYDKSAPCNHTGDRVYTNNGDGTHKVTCKACGATIVEKETHEFDPTGACVCGATQSGGNPTPDNPGTIVIIRPAEEEKPAQQPNPSTGANDLVGMAVAAAVAAALGSAALLRKHD